MSDQPVETPVKKKLKKFIQPVKAVGLEKRTPARFVPCTNIDALKQLNHGSLWVKIAEVLEDESVVESDVILYGVSSEAWQGRASEEMYITRDGVDETVPASTKIVGFYEQRDLPPQFANIWEEKKARANV